MLSAGFTCGELLEAGYTVKVLKEDAGFSCADLMLGGATAYQLQRSGFTSETMLTAGVEQSEIDDLTKGAASIGAEMKALSFMAKLKKNREVAAATASC